MNHESIYSSDKWRSFNGFSPLIKVYRSFHNLTSDIEFIINQQTFPITFKKNKFISSPLHRDNCSYLIFKGIVRGYMKDDNTEITTWLAKENEFVGGVSNFLDERATNEEYIQALEDVIAIVVPHSMTKLLHLNYHILNDVDRKMSQLYYRQACERALISRLHSAEKRYTRFVKSYPELVNRVPQKHIASFLCMRLETLSRMRAKLASHAINTSSL